MGVAHGIVNDLGNPRHHRLEKGIASIAADDVSKASQQFGNCVVPQLVNSQPPHVLVGVWETGHGECRAPCDVAYPQGAAEPCLRRKLFVRHGGPAIGGEQRSRRSGRAPTAPPKLLENLYNHFGRAGRAPVRGGGVVCGCPPRPRCCGVRCICI